MPVPEHSPDRPEAAPTLEQALQAVEQLYSGGIETYGATPHAVSWRDESSQRLRFVKLLSLLEPLPVTPVTVNDLGCGYGAMLAFLSELPGLTLAHYHGYDISRPMLDAAALTGDARASWHHTAEVTRTADYSFVSGTFNVKGRSTDDVWEAHVRRALITLAKHSRHGFAYNLLSTFVDYREPHLFYADPLELFRFIRDRLSPYVSLIHDYPLYEWTMVVRRPPPTSAALLPLWAQLEEA